MYCPVCFNDTLKITSSGVIKFSFNGKSKSTSQMYYNLSQDRDFEIIEKLQKVIDDYFSYYSNFQNKDTIISVEAYSSDFKCTNKCIIGINQRVNVIDLVFSKQELIDALNKSSKKYSINIDINKII